MTEGFFGTRAELEDISRGHGSTAYVVLQNDRLHGTVDRLHRRVREAERERDRAVSEAGIAERARVCLRGIMHNEIEKAQAGIRLSQTLRAARDHAAGVARFTGVSSAIGLAMHAMTTCILACTMQSSPVCKHVPDWHAEAAIVLLATHVAWTVWSAWRAVIETAPPDTSSLDSRISAAMVGTEHLHELVDEMN
jgi:hypothetical protein